MWEAERQAQRLKEHLQQGRHDYGYEWGEPDEDVIHHWIRPAVKDQRVMEIGYGGGRWTKTYADLTRSLVLVEGTPQAQKHIMLDAEFYVSVDGTLPDILDTSIDYVFSFGVFVHFHPELFEKYVQSISRVLKPAGKLHLHYARYFPDSEKFLPHSFYYRDDLDTQNLLQAYHLIPTGRSKSFLGGPGAKLVEAVRR